MDSAPPAVDSQTGPDYRDAFLRILNNRGKNSEKEAADSPPRKRGFVVIVRGASSLKLIQSLCFEQTYNECLTARYRLQPAAAIGTLVAAHLKDLQEVAKAGEDVAGELKPPSSEHVWRRMAEPYINELVSTSKIQSLPIDPSSPEEQGFLYRDHLRLALETLESEFVLKAGHRLVLLGELSEEATDLSEWHTALKILFAHLPERVGIVLSGAPKEFRLPTHDPHFLEITLSVEKEGRRGDPARFAIRYTDSSFHSDVPAEKDELGVNDYANAIARFIVHPQTHAPLTVGIHGPWGKGKSSFMKLVADALVKCAPVNRLPRPELNGESRTQAWQDLVTKINKTAPRIQALFGQESLDDYAKKEIDEYSEICDQELELQAALRKAAEENIIGITFNAWQFEDAKQTWAGLASQISERLEKALPWRSRQWLRISYAWKERKKDLILSTLLPLAVICIVGGLFSLQAFRNVALPQTPASNFGMLLQLLLPTGSLFLAFWFISSQVLKVAEPISERVLAYMSLPNYRDQMGFQHRVKEDLKFVHEFLINRRAIGRRGYLPPPGGCKVVVYIDDLDRCSDTKVMEILQAINLILADCRFFVFVGMDTEMIYRAIRSYYNDKVPERFPENYLSKILQISFFLPVTTSYTRVGYVSTLFSPAARLGLETLAQQSHGQEPTEQDIRLAGAEDSLRYDLTQVLQIVTVELKEAEDTPHELLAFTNYSYFLDDNPREIKRLINIHRLIKLLLQKENTSWTDVRQRKLVIWLIFCDLWPDLVGSVREDAAHLSSANCILDLAKALEGRKVAEPDLLDRLKYFSTFGGEADYLSSEDIDADFGLAADLSQLVHKSHILRTNSK